MTYILALDQGTSSSRGIVFDIGRDNARIVAVGQRTFDMSFPRDGWVEQDPETLWQTTLEAGREAIAKAGEAGIEPTDIAGVGITNQRETTLLWNRSDNQTVYPAIVWQDRRTAERCEQMRVDGLESMIRTDTGLVIDPYFSATKLAWLLENNEVHAAAERGELCFGTVDSFVIWRLTSGAVHVTDATNASRTQLFDIRRNRWHEELLAVHGIPKSVLPTVVDSSGEIGVCDRQWFGAPIPILGCAGDQQAALVGQACLKPGMTKSTYGTGCFVINNTGAELVRSNNRLLSTIAYRCDGVTTYALEGSIFVAGQAVKWLRDQLGLIHNASDSAAAMLRTGGDTDGVYVVPAFTGLGAPHWNAEARGLITGLTLNSTVDQLVTATLHSVAYQTAELLAAMAADGAPVTRLRVDGGMVVNDPLCQFIADIVDVPVERPKVIETTALGAALLAAVGAGLAADLTSVSESWRLDTTFQSGMERDLRHKRLDGWRRAVDRAR